MFLVLTLCVFFLHFTKHYCNYIEEIIYIIYNSNNTLRSSLYEEGLKKTSMTIQAKHLSSLVCIFLGTKAVDLIVQDQEVTIDFTCVSPS